MTDREQQILALIKADPLISQQKLADQLAISRSAVASHIANLMAKGAIKGKGYVVDEGQYCAVIGGANMDIVGNPSEVLTPASSTPGTVSSSPGGVGRNIAENLSRLGNDCYLFAPVGRDDLGRQLLEHSANAGINTAHVSVIDGQSTSSYLSILDNSGEMQLAIADMAILQHFSADHLSKYIPLLKRAELVTVDCNLSPPLLEFLVSQLAADTPIFVDPVSVAKCTRIRPFLSSIHTLKPNLQEAQTIAGRQITNDQELPSLADWFHGQGVARIFISLGEGGLFYSDGAVNEIAALPAQRVCNSNGAGDALMAALGHCWMQGMAIDDTAQFALAAGNIALQSERTINPDMSVFLIQKMLEDS